MEVEVEWEKIIINNSETAVIFQRGKLVRGKKKSLFCSCVL